MKLKVGDKVERTNHHLPHNLQEGDKGEVIKVYLNGTIKVAFEETTYKYSKLAARQKLRPMSINNWKEIIA